MSLEKRVNIIHVMHLRYPLPHQVSPPEGEHFSKFSDPTLMIYRWKGLWLLNHFVHILCSAPSLPVWGENFLNLADTPHVTCREIDITRSIARRLYVLHWIVSRILKEVHICDLFQLFVNPCKHLRWLG